MLELIRKADLLQIEIMEDDLLLQEDIPEVLQEDSQEVLQEDLPLLGLDLLDLLVLHLQKEKVQVINDRSLQNSLQFRQEKDLEVQVLMETQVREILKKD